MDKVFNLILSLLILILVTSCKGPDPSLEKERPSSYDPNDYIKPIPGDDQVLDSVMIKKGLVLIAYSDCYDCHKEDSRAKGPAFQDIAKRYPANRIYIGHLARKIISGGSGAWGYPVMSPHPDIENEDAKAMATFILSLRSQ
jgi:cytochrome c